MVNHVIRAPLIRLLKSSSMGLTQDYFDSELIKPSLNACSENENSEFDIFEFVYIEDVKRRTVSHRIKIYLRGTQTS